MSLAPFAQQRFILVLREIDECERFFGVRVNVTCPLNVEMWKAVPRPEWLRGKPNLKDLPRHSRIGKTTPHFRIEHRKPTITTMAERTIWVIENCTGPWKVQYKLNPAMFFTDERDAVHYRLRFEA